jgi:exosortase A
MIALSAKLGGLFGHRSAKSGGVWQQPLRLLAAAWAGLLLLFWQDARDMAVIWWTSSTFNHCLLILPIIVWLVVQRKEQLAKLTPQSYWPALVYAGAGAGGWLLGDAAGVAIARQLGLLMMLQGSAATMLGRDVTRGLLFPLFYMFFLLPFGEEAVPVLQTVTAKMCMTLLGWTNIPAHIDGIFISTPTGYFKVAEACSGVKFLVAMVAYGALVSNLCFKSWARRIVFMAVCVAVPVLANSVRAFGTIYIADHTTIAFAAGFDHVFYGWIFFAIVIAAVMAIGWRFFDKDAGDLDFDAATWKPAAKSRMTFAAALAGILAVAIIPWGWSAMVAAQFSLVPKQIFLPKVNGWRAVTYAPQVPWKPRFDGAAHELIGRYQNANGKTADLYIAVFDRQGEGRELVGFGQGAVDPDSAWAWTAQMPAPPYGKAERIKAPRSLSGPVSRDVISYYRVGGVTSGANSEIKLATLKARLLGGNQQAAAILVSAEYENDISPRSTIDQFTKDLGNIDNLADRMAGID